MKPLASINQSILNLHSEFTNLLEFAKCCSPKMTLPETNSSHLKMDGWKIMFLLGPGFLLVGAITVTKMSSLGSPFPLIPSCISSIWEIHLTWALELPWIEKLLAQKRGGF